MTIGGDGHPHSGGVDAPCPETLAKGQAALTVSRTFAEIFALMAEVSGIL